MKTGIRILAVVSCFAVSACGPESPTADGSPRDDVAGNAIDPLVATSDVLRNPKDNRQKLVFDPEFRGKTDRFIPLFEKLPG